MRCVEIFHGFERLGVYLVEGRNFVVPLEERGGGTAAFDRPGVKIPDGVEYGMVMCIENVLFKFRVASDVNLRDAVRGNSFDVLERIEAVVLRGDINVVYIEKNPAVCLFGDFVEELPFSHHRDMKLGVD